MADQLEHPWLLPADPHPFKRLCGVIRPPGWRRTAASLPTLADAAPDLAFDPNKSTLLYKCWEAVYSGMPDYPAQQIGDCVSFGNGHGIDLLETVEVYLGDLELDAVHRTATEALYGMAREISGDLGPWDGSYGGAAAKAMTTWGDVSYADLGDLGFDTVYSGSRAKQWGRTGVPQKVKDAAASSKLRSAALVTTIEEAGAAIQNGHPVPICTAYGFTMTRDEQGRCQLRGRWGHCMCLAAYRGKDSGFNPGFLVLQSWGPDQPGGATVLGQPSWSFWADTDDISRILAEGDSYALAGATGYRRKSMPSELIG